MGARTTSICHPGPELAEGEGAVVCQPQPHTWLVLSPFDLPACANHNRLMDLYEEIVRLRKDGRRGAVATIVNVRGSIPSFKTAKMLVRDDGSIVGTIGGGCVEAEVWQAAREVMESERPRTLTFDLNQDPKYDTGLVCGGTLEIFVEPILPPADLYIFGAGHVATSLYKVARIAGFDVTIVDDREAYANRAARAQRVFLHRHCHARTPRRHAHVALGGTDSGALRRDDRVEAEDHHHFQRAAAGRRAGAFV